MDEVAEYGTRTAEGGGTAQRRRTSSGRAGAALATFVSIIALVVSGYSFYETVIKAASLRFRRRWWRCTGRASGTCSRYPSRSPTMGAARHGALVRPRGDASPDRLKMNVDRQSEWGRLSRCRRQRR
jgi:hypothetical protein